MAARRPHRRAGCGLGGAGGAGEGGGGVAAAAGVLVGGVVPAAGQPGDDGGAAAADHQREPGRVAGGSCRVWRRRGGWRAPGRGCCQAAWPHRSLAALRVVVSVIPGRNTFTEEVSSTTWRPCSPHRPASCASPCATAQTWMPLPPGVGQPDRQRHRADLGDLVQAHQQRRVQPPPGRGLPDLGGGVVDLAGHRGEQGRHRRLLGHRLGDHVHGPRRGAGTARCRTPPPGRAAPRPPAPGRS